MPKYTGTQVRNRTLTNVNNLKVLINPGDPPKIVITNRLVYNDGSSETDEFELVQANASANLRPRNFNRTPKNLTNFTGVVRFNELLDEAVRQANEAKYGISLTLAPGGGSDDEIT